ncbi:hypothetical protein FRB91_006483 [Serendipita sp. 411]|nr:hypothetical protein FRB91_006483 [Serendipita sp. 411]
MATVQPSSTPLESSGILAKIIILKIDNERKSLHHSLDGSRLHIYLRDAVHSAKQALTQVEDSVNTLQSRPFWSMLNHIRLSSTGDSTIQAFTNTLHSIHNSLQSGVKEWKDYELDKSVASPSKSDRLVQETLVRKTNVMLDTIVKELRCAYKLLVLNGNNTVFQGGSSDKSPTTFFSGVANAWGANKLQLLLPSLSPSTEVYFHFNPPDPPSIMYKDHLRKLGSSWMKELHSAMVDPPQQHIIQAKSNSRNYDDIKLMIENLFTNLVQIGPIDDEDLVKRGLPATVNDDWSRIKACCQIPRLMKTRTTQNATPPLRICNFGVLSHGKSSFINALLNKSILPSKDYSTTAWPLVIKHSSRHTEPELIIHSQNIVPWLRKLQSKLVNCDRRPVAAPNTAEWAENIRMDEIVTKNLSEPAIKSLKKFNQLVLKDGQLMAYEFPTSATGDDNVRDLVNEINDLMHICWQVLREDDLVYLDNMDWPEIYVDMGDLGTSGDLNVEILDLPGVFDENGQCGKKSLPDHFVQLAAQQSHGAIWVLKSFFYQNSQCVQARKRAGELFKDNFLGVYGTWRDDVLESQEPMVQKGLLGAAYGKQYTGSLRVNLCVPGIYTSAIYTIAKTNPFVKKEDKLKASLGDDWWKWSDHKLIPDEDPPNMPKLSYYSQDDVCSKASRSNTTSYAIIILYIQVICKILLSDRNRKREYQRYFKKEGLQRWMEELERHKENWDFEDTRIHFKNFVVIDGEFRLWVYQLRELERKLADYIQRQESLIEIAQSRIYEANEDYDAFLGKAVATINQWEAELPELRAAFEEYINDSVDIAKTKAYDVVAQTVREVASGGDYEGKYNPETEEITLGDTKGAVLFIQKINQVIKPKLAAEQRSLDQETCKKAHETWKYRLQTLIAQFDAQTDDMNTFFSREIITALKGRVDRMKDTVYDLIKEELAKTTGSSSEASKLFDDALSKPWLPIEQAKATLSGHPKNLSEHERIVVQWVNRMGPIFRYAIPATFTLTKNSRWDFMENKSKVSLNEIIVTHQSVIANSWAKVIQDETRKGLVGTLETATQAGSQTVMDILNLLDQRKIQATKEVYHNFSPELLGRMKSHHAACVGALGALEEIHSSSKQRLGMEVLSPSAMERKNSLQSRCS